MYSPTYAGHPGLVQYMGSFSPVAGGAATTNQVLSAAFAPVTIGTQGQALGGVMGTGAKNVSLATVDVVANVNYATIGWFGVATNANNVNIYTLRFSGAMSGQICQAQADLIPGPASATTIATSATNTAAVLGQDSTNRLVYIGVVTQAAGTLTNSGTGDIVNFVITFCDSSAP